MDLVANEDQLYFSLDAKLTRNPPIDLNSVSVCPRAIQRFLSDTDEHASISECSIQNNWCSVLPSMKKGQIVCIKKSLPQGGLFHSYKDVKKYWKNMYGYRLPENDIGMLYFQIYFKRIGQQLFTYPEVCLRPRDIMTFNCPDVAFILQQFLTDMHTKLPTICGTKLQMRSDAMFVDRQLLSVQEIRDTQECNLTAQKVVDKSQYNPRQPVQQRCIFKEWKPSASVDVKSNEHTKISHNYSVNMSANLPKPNQISSSAHHILAYQTNDRVITPKDNPSIRVNLEFGHEKVLKNISTIHATPTSTGADESNLPKKQTAESRSRIEAGNEICDKEKTANFHATKFTAGNKIVPIFKAIPKTTGISINRNNLKSQPKSIPIFKSSQNQRSSQKFCRAAVSQDMFFDLEKVRANLEKMEHLNSGKSHNSTIQSKFKPQVPNTIKPSDNVRPIFASGNSQKQPNHRNQLNPKSSENVPNLCKPFVHSCGMLKQNITTTAMVPRTDMLGDGADKANKCGGSKRKSTDNPAEINAKKPRAKPKIQEGINIGELAANNQLGKVNTATLAAWLKERGLPCKSKDKKQDLVARIMVALSITVTEQ